MYTRSRVYTERDVTNRVTDFLPAVSANSESCELISNTNDCLEAPFCVVIIRLTSSLLLIFRGKGPVTDVC